MNAKCHNCNEAAELNGDNYCAKCVVADIEHGMAHGLHIPDHASPAMGALIDEYQRKAKREGFLHLGDASEALAVTHDYQLRGWLSDFILRWEATEALEAGKLGPDDSDAERMARALIAILGTPRNASADAFHRHAREALRTVVKS